MTFFKYLQPSEMTNDLENGYQLVYEKGLVDAIMISAKENTADGFIMVYTRAFNSTYKNNLRFSYTLSEFQNLTFSKEAVGLSYYITQDELNNTLYGWNLLTNSEKEFYNTGARNFMTKGFIPFWKPEWNIQPSPSSQVIVKKGGNILTSGVGIATNATTNVQASLVFEISNVGTSMLECSGISTLPTQDITIIPPTDLTLMPGEAVSFGINLLYTTPGTKNFTIRVSTNDPVNPFFSIPVTVTVD